MSNKITRVITSVCIILAVVASIYAGNYLAAMWAGLCLVWCNLCFSARNLLDKSMDLNNKVMEALRKVQSDLEEMLARALKFKAEADAKKKTEAAAAPQTP